MSNNKRQNRKRKVSGSLWNMILNHFKTISVIVLSGMVMGYVFFNKEGLPAYYGMVQDSEQLEEEIQQLLEMNVTLRQDIDRIQHDSRKLEELARVQLGMVRQDELVYQFVDPQPPQLDPTSVAEAEP